MIRPSDEIDMRTSISSSSPVELARSRSVHLRFHTGLKCLLSDSLLAFNYILLIFNSFTIFSIKNYFVDKSEVIVFVLTSKIWILPLNKPTANKLACFCEKAIAVTPASVL